MYIGLEITDQGSNNWKAHTNEFVRESQLNMYRIGDTLHVKYDPTEKMWCLTALFLNGISPEKSVKFR